MIQGDIDFSQLGEFNRSKRISAIQPIPLFLRPYGMRYLIVAFLLLVACNKNDEPLDPQVLTAVQNAESFVEGAIPQGIEDLLTTSSTLVLGETHYVQQHQDFIGDLLPVAHAKGYRVVYDELFHCFSWLVEDYVTWKRDEIPEFLRYLNETTLQAIRSFNKDKVDSEMILLKYMDMNHWQDNMQVCIDELEKILGPVPVFSILQGIAVDSPAYLTALQDLDQEIQFNPEQYREAWGDKWYDRIVDIVSMEIVSTTFRTERDNVLREDMMMNNMAADIESSTKVLVNTGMYHAQKHVLLGEDIQRIAAQIVAMDASSRSVAFVALKGERRNSFNSTTINFDLTNQMTDNDLVRHLHLHTVPDRGFLMLSDATFAQQNIRATFTPGSTVFGPVGSMFDAIVLYPEVTVLESMTSFSFD